MPIGYVITPDDVQGALSRQGTREPGEGDVVLFYTGHGKLWMKDNAEYNKGCPGPGVTAGKWLIDKRVCLVGGDQWAVEAVPGGLVPPPGPIALHRVKESGQRVADGRVPGPPPLERSQHLEELVEPKLMRSEASTEQMRNFCTKLIRRGFI